MKRKLTQIEQFGKDVWARPDRNAALVGYIIGFLVAVILV
jgi:hypothetical protein